MNLDFGAMLRLRGAWQRFNENHPKAVAFGNEVYAKGFEVGQEIAVAVRYPDGTEFKTGIRVQESDLELLEIVKSLAQR